MERQNNVLCLFGAFFISEKNEEPCDTMRCEFSAIALALRTSILYQSSKFCEVETVQVLFCIWTEATAEKNP